MIQHTISQWSKILQIHRVTIYKKIRAMNEEIQNYITYENEVMLLDERAIPILFKDHPINNEPNEENIENDVYLEKYIQEIESEVAFLKKEIDQKNQQIDKLTHLIYNNQILLQEKQEKQQQYLSEEIDKIKKEKKKNFFERLFSKKE